MPAVQPIVLRFHGNGCGDAAATRAPRRAAFLDRDGVINLDHGFVGSREQWVWMGGAQQAIWRLNLAGFAVVVVSNQSGIGRGLFTEQAFIDLMYTIESELESSGGHLDAVYACPHHPTMAIGPYLTDCDCRKPKPGLLVAAIRDLGLDAGASVLIGDSERDIEAARAAGVRGLLFAGDDLLGFIESHVLGEAR